MRRWPRALTVGAALLITISTLAAEGTIAMGAQRTDDEPSNQAARTRSLPVSASLVLTTDTAEPPLMGPDDEPDHRLRVAPGSRSILVIGIRPTGLVDRTSGPAPRITVDLPAGLILRGARTLTATDVDGEWTCTGGSGGSSTVTCDLRTSDGDPGTIATESLTEVALILSPAAGREEVSGPVTVTASARGESLDGAVTPMSDSLTIEAITDRTMPPDVRFRLLERPDTATRNAFAIEVLTLSPLDDSGRVTLDGIVPDGARAVSISGVNWNCRVGRCVAKATLRPGQPSIIEASFITPDGTDPLRWTIETSYPGASLTRGVPIPGGLVVIEPRATSVAAEPVVNIDTARGQSLAAGRRLPIVIRVTDDSGADHSLPTTVSVTPPLRLSMTADGWTCTGSICVGPGAPRLRAVVVAPSSTPEGDHIVTVTAGDPGTVVRATAPLHVIDPGDPFPQVSLERMRNGRPVTWTDGRVARVRVGAPSDYRLRVTNVGGAAMAPGTTVTLTQQAAAGARFVAASSPGTCRVSDTAWTCDITTADAVGIGTLITTVDVRFTATSAARVVALGPVSVSAGSSSLSSTPVPYRAVRADVPVRIAAMVDEGITAGGRSRAALSLRPRTSPVAGIVVSGTFPAGVTPAAASAWPWSCTASGARVECAYAGILDSRTRIEIPLTAGPDVMPGLASIAWSVRAADPTYAPVRTSTGLVISAAGALTAEAVPAILARRVAGSRPTRVLLQAATTAGSSAWTHSWEQLCLSPGDLGCTDVQAARSAVPLRRATSATATALIPVRRDARTYVFRVTSTDGSSTLQRIVRVEAAGSASGSPLVLTQRRAVASAVVDTARAAVYSIRPWMLAEMHVPKRASVSATALTRATGSVMPFAVPGARPLTLTIKGSAIRAVTAGQIVSLPAVATGGVGDYDIDWHLIAGRPVSLSSMNESTPTFTVPAGTRIAIYEATVTDGRGARASATVTLSMNASGTPHCDLVDDATDGTLSWSLGDTAVSSTQAERIGTSCDSRGGVHFRGATVTVGGFTVTNAEGTIAAAGIALTAGDLAAPTTWDQPSLRPARGLTLSFGESAMTPAGRYIVSSFPFLPLPNGWHGRTAVVFTPASSTGVRVVGAGRSAVGGRARLSGAVHRSGTFTRLPVEADDLVLLGGTPVSVAGRLSLPAGAEQVTGAATGDLAGAVTLVSGATVPALTVTWSRRGASAVTGRGTLTLESGTRAVDVPARLAYTGRSSWALRVSSAVTWKPAEGLAVSRMSGAVRSTKRGYDWDITANLDGAWRATDAVTVRTRTARVSDACPIADAACPPASLYLAVAGTVRATGLPTTLAAAGSGVVGLGPDPARFITAPVSAAVDLGPGLTMTDTDLIVREGAPATLPELTESALAAELVGDSDLAGVGRFEGLRVAVTSTGWGFASATSADLGEDTGRLSNAVIAYATRPAIVTVDGSREVDIADCPDRGAAEACTDTLLLGGDYTAPSWLTRTIGVDDSTAVALEIDPATGVISDSVRIPLTTAVRLPVSGATDVEVSQLTVRLSGTREAAIATATGAAALDLPYALDSPAMSITLGFDPQERIVSGHLNVADGQPWTSAFGADGFDLSGIDLSYSYDFDEASLNLSAAQVTLPDDLGTTFAIPDDARALATADLDANDPCLTVDLDGRADGSEPVITIADGAVTAAQARLIVAPGGCRHGDRDIAAGYQLDLSADVLGQQVSVSAPLTRGPVTLRTRTAVPALFAGDLALADAVLRLNVAEGAAGAVRLDGSADVLGESIRFTGPITMTDGDARADLSGSGHAQVSGFDVTQLDLSLTATADTARMTGSADVTVMDSTLTLPKLDVTLDNHVVSDIVSSAPAEITLPTGVSVSGSFTVRSSATPDTLTISASGSIGAGDLVITDATLELSPQCADIDGRVSVRGLATSRLTGYLAWAPDCVRAGAGNSRADRTIDTQPGALCLAVTSTNLTVAGFDARGSMTLSNNRDSDCGGSTRTPGAAAIGVRADLILGRQSVANTITVSGQVDADGGYVLSGSGRLTISGFALTMDVTASKSSQGQRIEGGAALTLLGNSLKFNGAFQSSPGGPSVALSASVSPLRVGGFSLGSGQVRLYQGGSSNGMYFDANLNVGVARLASTITFRQNGSTFLFYTSVAMRLGIPGVASVSASGTFTNCSDPTCSGPGGIRLTGKASMSLGRWRVSTPPFEISTQGGFSIRVKEGRSGISTSRTGVLGVDWWVGDASWNIDVTINESGVSGSARGRATIYSQETALKYPCGPWYWVFRDWCDYPRTNWGSVGASASFNPWGFCFNVAGSPDICLRL